MENKLDTAKLVLSALLFIASIIGGVIIACLLLAVHSNIEAIFGLFFVDMVVMIILEILIFIVTIVIYKEENKVEIVAEPQVNIQEETQDA